MLWGKDRDVGPQDTMALGMGAEPHSQPMGPQNPWGGVGACPCEMLVAQPWLQVLAQHWLFPSHTSCWEHCVPTSRLPSQGTDSAPAGLLLWH